VTENKDKKRIGVLRGGTDEGYENSLREGGDFIAYVLENLGDKHKPVDILVDREGLWHVDGIPVKPFDLVHRVDIVWNTSHGSLSQILENFSIPNIKAARSSSIFSKSQEMLRTHMQNIGVKMPRSIILPLYQEDFDGPRSKYALGKAKEVLEKFPPPWVVKSFTPDSSMGIHLAKTFPELVRSIEDGVEHEKSILVEEFIMGKVASVHSLSDFRGEDVYVFPLIIFKNIPHNFSSSEKEKVLALARDLHTHLGAEHYLKSDFVLHRSGNIFVTGVDFSPNLNKGSHFCDSCESVGTKTHNVVGHILNRALV